MAYQVPNPYVVTTHPYPTRYHGGIWTRPVFGLPYQRSVQSVFKCDDFNDSNPGLSGVGALPPRAERAFRALSRGAIPQHGLGEDYNVGNGVFGTGRDGGGVFGPSLYGLGSQSDDMEAIANYILSTSTVSVQAFDIQGEFRSWYNGLGPYDKNFSDDAMAKANSYRDRFNAANVRGGGSAAPNPPAPSGSAAQPLTEAAIKAVQTTLSAALVNAGYNPISADGKIGAGTCGAIAWYQQTVNPSAGAQFASVCATKKPWTAPSKKSSGGGYRPPTPVTMPEPAQASMVPTGMGAGTWAMIGGGALAIGLAVIGKKKGWF
jgi:hypothetical protein